MAEQDAARLGLSMVDISGGEALIRKVRRSVAMVDWLAARVAGLNERQQTFHLLLRKRGAGTSPAHREKGQKTRSAGVRHPVAKPLCQEPDPTPSGLPGDT